MSQYLDKDGASRIAENFLSKQAEQDVILENLQFDLKEVEHALVKTIQGPAPLNIRALTRPLDDYCISGSTLQNGTPTPEAPVDVVGCGERTENLFDRAGEISSYYINTSGVINSVSSGVWFVSDFTQVQPNSTYTFTYNSAPGVAAYHAFYDADKELISTLSMETHTFTTPNNARYMRFSYRNGSYDIMLNAGSTPLPYEPYGYKLPISCGGTTTNVYLGEQSATRRIRKFVLTGEESWNISATAKTLYLDLSGHLTGELNICFCTHYKSVSNVSSPSMVEDGEITFNDSLCWLYIKDNNYNNVDGFKSYLAAQYAAGTPVTVWYVLAEPETAVVNEPLHKIGDYADTVSFTQSGVEISTTKGFNTITTDTTVLPSNIEVKGVINNA